MVRIRVLGAVGAEVAGRPVDLGAARQRALLARLVAAGGHVVSTDLLIEDLWQGRPPPKALAALQVHVSNLRRVLEPDRPPRAAARVVVTAPPGYRLDLAAGAVDAWRFRGLFDEAAAALADGRHGPAITALDEALGLWAGEPFGEFTGAVWAAAAAAELAELRLVAVEHRAQAALHTGRAAEVVPELERHVRAHPLRENPVRLLALAYYRSGRQGDALRVLRRARRTLADELGVDPGPWLRRLEHDILNQAVPLAGEPAGPSAAGAVRTLAGPAAGRPPAVRLVGREEELARLAEAAAQARAGALRVVWLGGEAGAGKTALAEALARRLEGEGWSVAFGRCPETDDGAPPAWAWTEIVRTLAGAHPPAAGPRERLGALLGGEPSPGGQFALAGALAGYLAEVAGAAPLLVVLEDVHRADDETLHLLRQAAVRAAAPVLVVATHRPDEQTGDLAATWAALAGRAAAHLPLGGLERPQVAELLRDRSGTRVDERTVRLVAERTGGNPLFVVETARLLASDGPAAAHGLPPGVRDLLRDRIARLPAAARTVLRDAAVIGRDVDVDLLIAMREAGPEDGRPDAQETVLDGLEAGVLTGLLVEPAPGQVRFAHVLAREALYEEIPRIRRGRLHGRVLAALERLRPGDVTALGHHALASATTATARKAAEYAAGAAARAADLHAHREAAALLTGALGALEAAADDDDALRLRLLCGLVSAQAHAGDVMGARRNRAGALEVARRLGDPDAAARALTAFDAPVTWTIQPDRQVDEAIVAALEDALAGGPGAVPHTRCRLLAALAFELEGHGDERVQTAGAEALRIARRLGDPRLLCTALNARYFPALDPARRDELEAIGAELVRTGATSGLLGYQMQGHHALFMVALGRGDLARARHHADRAIEHSTGGQLGLSLAALSLFDALTLLVRGDFAAAERRYTAVTDQMAAAGAPHGLAMGVLGRFAVAEARGRAEEMVPELEVLVGYAPEDVSDLYVRALVCAGRVEQARAFWRRDLYLRRDYFWQMRLVLRGLNAMALRDRAVAEESYRLLLPWAGEAAGLHSGTITFGPVGLFLGELAGWLGDAAAAAGHYAAALTVAERLGAPHWAERARRAAGRAGGGSGQDG